MNIVVVGLSHKTAPVEIREKVSIQEAKIDQAIAQLKAYPHIEEVAIISTCNRLEVYAVTAETEQGVKEIVQFLAERGQVSLTTLRRYLFTLLHEDAIRHLMRVAAGLESLVLGEGQILAQVKHTHKLAQEAKGISQLLDRLFKQAMSAGKRVRTETNIGTGAVSISSAAVELAQMKVESLAPLNIGIIGAGKMSRLLVQHLVAKGAKNIALVNRSHTRAEELASQYRSEETNITVHLLPEMMEIIANSDLVFTSTSSTEPILDKANLIPVLDSHRTVILIDIAVPRNVSADCSELDNVRAYNVDDLKAVVAQNQESRRKMAQEAEALLEEEVESYLLWWRFLETVPTISCLQTKMEAIREQELEKALSRLGSEFGDKHQEIIEALTKGIVKKILHEPMLQLRAQQDIEARRRCLQSLQMLFNLDIGEQYS
jgi:glutamyl-tRNA reductase